nr:hypothetical protein MPGNBCFJ_00001 [Methanosarcinales archaeon ANME-2c ERB4]QNO42051.1 hypothetical protein NIICAKKE_00001 [Methanosarcinales archaeon ANME-2c ERB4]QNO42302.1 hypothetical protein OEDCDHIP_00019 [Methanosarcinales archaeon ANME-2c ERB4]QNO42834.1 hypothetical protein KIACKMEK_00001 [Methanosarcinales archaeon ANME-2c ERB4]QNO43004.1 hypothetical protein ABGNOHFO_00023 [Methanosarcinales archaeon ANME-2c ERB4]
MYIMSTVAYRTWNDYDNIVLGNSDRRVPDTFYTDFSSPNEYTTWTSLNKFFTELATVTRPYSEYAGCSGKGHDLLCRFFAEHELFRCHIEQEHGRNILVKDKASESNTLE